MKKRISRSLAIKLLHFSTCCEIGARSATHDIQCIDNITRFGELVGLAFQIRDDLLDYVSRTNLIGKPYANDLKEKKITLPLIHALRTSPKSEAKSILGMIKKGNLQTSDIAYIMNFVKQYGGIDYAQNTSEALIKEAIQLLDIFPDSVYKSSLKDFAHFVIQRAS